jgi:hypothetical protein
MLGLPPRRNTAFEKEMIRLFFVLLIAVQGTGCVLLMPDPSSSDTTSSDYPGSPAKPLPRGWKTADLLRAEWGDPLNEILGSLPDTSSSVEYWKDEIQLESGKRLPILRARIQFDHTTKLNRQRVELRFVNVDYIYDTAESSAEHYMLEGVTKTIELTASGYPKIHSEDVLRKKVLMVYGTPQNYNGVTHSYSDQHTFMAVRVLDNSRLMFTMSGHAISLALQNALIAVYSEEGIDLKKEEILKDFEL